MATLRYTVLPAVSAAALLAFVATPSWQSATTGASSTLIRPAAAAALEAPRKADIVTDDSMAQHDPALMRLVGELRARHELDRPDPAGAAAGPAMTSTAGDTPPATATTPVREATVPQAAGPQGPATPRPATAAAEPGLGERLLSAIGDLFDGEGEDQPRTTN